uniref:Retrovirus-related Pol polyprotein from transposon TNT 1-94-like beta-barrel domain-containing protein n=1 Tax=Chenopodium quinoa TaxID=63459 RepID=A0A803NEP2_CHEQI
MGSASGDAVLSTQMSSGINFNDPYYLSNGDHPGMQLGNHILTGSNFLNWSRTKWIRNDYMVMSWLLNSMDKNLVESFMFVNSSCQLWNELVERFGHTTAPRLFELHRSLTSTQQDNSSIAEYFGRLKAIWDQLQILEGFPDCTCGAMKNCTCGMLKKILETDQRNKLMQLLSGLNRSYDPVITNMLSADPLPHVHKAYHTLQQVEQQNKLNDVKVNIPELSALHVAKTFPKHVFQNFKKDFKKQRSDVVCNYCKKKGHSIDQCFQLNGFPDWWNKDKVSSTNSNESGSRFAANISSVGDEILGKAPEYGDSSGSVASGSVDPVMASALYHEVLKMMRSGDSSVQDNPLSAAVNFAVKVSLPDGTVNLVKHVGNVSLNQIVTLENVFYIPQFKHNLLSVGRLLDKNKLLAVFESDSCYFQDLATKQVVAGGTRDQNMENCNAAPFPMSKGLRLNMDNGDLLGDPEVYRRLIGKLLYLNMSRPGISYVLFILLRIHVFMRKLNMRGKSQKIDVHYIREQVQSGFIQLKHVRSVLQLADIMTKPLGSDQHRFLSSKIGLVNNAPIQEWPGISQLAHS